MTVKKPNPTESRSAFEEWLGRALYWRGGTISARVRVAGKLTWRSTGTANPKEARRWLKKWRSEEWMEQHGIEPKGVILHRSRVTVGELIDAYVEAGLPTRKMRPKRPATITNEKACLRPVRTYFGGIQAAAVAAGDCDKYRDWRLAGGYFAGESADDRRKRMERMKKGTRSVDLELTILGNVFNLAMRRGRGAGAETAYCGA